jgi:hypothetical protein
MMAVIDGDPSVPTWDEVVDALSDPAGRFGMPANAVANAVTTGDPSTIGERLAGYADAGAHRVIVTVAAGDWHRQAELLAEAIRSLG